MRRANAYRWTCVVLGVWTMSLVVAAQSQTVPDARTAEQRAVVFLVDEVPRWRREHPCYSCHNNGDGARALIVASRAGLLELGRVDDAVRWLGTPERWALNSDQGGVKDLPLSRIQFSAALAALRDAGAATQPAIDRAADLVAADQRPDGAWPISATSNVGTPTGYGTPLATAMARSVLRQAQTDAARRAVANADAWFRGFEPQAVLEASAALLGVDGEDGAGAMRDRSLAILRQGQARDGGWGPYTTSPSEPFDTAVAVIALSTLLESANRTRVPVDRDELSRRIQEGRRYLLSTQGPDGSWPETTRPAGQESYSQRVSTTAWALLALLDERSTTTAPPAQRGN